MENRIDMIKNETLAKLTRDEIGALGLYHEGIMTYKGDLKTRYNGITRKSEDGVTYRFEGTNGLIMEFTEIISTNDEGKREWAARLYNKKKGRYETYLPGISGCDFFR